jgi:uncharacterized damage-inducible protein DinB
MSLKYLAWLTDTEYQGKSVNGKSFKETLNALSFEEAMNRETFEGFSAWDMVFHNFYWKNEILSFIGEKIETGFEEKNFPKKKELDNEAEWKEMLELSDTIHTQYMKALENLEEDALDEDIESWDMKLGHAIAWIASHDSYHNAQLRSMGIPSLKELQRNKKE